MRVDPIAHLRTDERLLAARDLGDEAGDQALDLGRWQVVAGVAVRQAHIAANHEGAQARLGEALCQPRGTKTGRCL